MRVLVSIVLAAWVLPADALAEEATAASRAKSRDFDARADIACAQDIGPLADTCSAAVARVGTAAVVVVTFSNGFARTLTFADGAFVRGNPTMSGVGTDTDWTLSDGIYHVRVDDQQFALPASLVVAR